MCYNKVFILLLCTTLHFGEIYYMKKEVKFKSKDTHLDFNKQNVKSVIQNATSEGVATQAGIQSESLQTAIDNYAKVMNQSAIAKSTGLPVRSPTQSYKGFAAEEYFKNTLKINALSKGIPDYKIGAYTKGELPDGSVLSGIDMETDISIWTRKHAWNKPKRTTDYQSKIHNDKSAYSKDINNPQYKDVQFVGGSGQGVNDTIKVKIGTKTITSDSITPKEAAKLADEMKSQSTTQYGKKQEKFNELNKVTLSRAVKAGAAIGCISNTIQEIVGVVKNSNNLSEKQFRKSIENILLGTMEGSVRGGAIAGSVQLLGKMIGKEVAANSLEAIPAMSLANVAVDFSKDLYKCFVNKSIDTDDLLCNSVNNVFSSTAGFGGAWTFGRIGGHVANQFNMHTFTQGLSMMSAAKSSAETGAAIGSAFGPIGTVVGSVVGGMIIGLGANAIIDTANKDAYNAFKNCVNEINSHIELSGFDKLYYFADSMSDLTDFRLSFKNLLPCYNLISDLREYNLHKKAIKDIRKQLEYNTSVIDNKKNKALQLIEQKHQQRIEELHTVFEEQKELMLYDFKESLNNYLSNSYKQYVKSYEIITGRTEELLVKLQNNELEHSYILDYMQNKNEINQMFNNELQELIDNDRKELVSPLIDKIVSFMKNDKLIVGCQYISYEESLNLIKGAY